MSPSTFGCMTTILSFVRKSNDALRDQLLAASRTNLSPDFIEVFVSGRVKEPGPQQLPQGASLNQAIASAGGLKLLEGRVEFLRFTQEGATDRRISDYNPKATSGDYRNPVLMPGDVVRVNESLVSASLELLNEISSLLLVCIRFIQFTRCSIMTTTRNRLHNSKRPYRPLTTKSTLRQVAMPWSVKRIIGGVTVGTNTVEQHLRLHPQANLGRQL